MLVLRMEIDGVAMNKTPLQVFEEMVLSRNFKRVSLTLTEGVAYKQVEAAAYEHRERVGSPDVGVPMVPVLTVRITDFSQE